jgi:phage I-like protein
MSKISGLLACQAIRNDALASADLPKRLKLLNWGTNDSKKGPIVVGPHTLSSLAANQALYGFDKVGIDYEHQSVPEHPNFLPPPREYAAYGVPRVIDGEGLFLEDIEWTPSGLSKARNYIDLSPTPLIENGEVSFLHSVALCPQGAVEGLSFFAADFKITKPTHKPMNPELLKLLSVLFNVPATSDEQTLLAAGKTFVENAAKESKDDAPGMTALTSELNALSARFDASERENIINAAVAVGKIVPNSAKDLPVDKLRALVAELPAAQVPLDKRTPEQVQALSATLNATDLAVCQQLGIKPEDFKK